jgi:hypothetical protein
MRWVATLAALLLGLELTTTAQAQAPVVAAPSVTVTFPTSMGDKPLDGRLILLFERTPGIEPRTAISPDELLKSPNIVGVNLEGVKPGQSVAIAMNNTQEKNTQEWPMGTKVFVANLGEDYTIQAVFNRYETFHRADGSVVKLPPDHGEGQNFATKPGNFYSTPIRVHFGGAGPAQIAIILDKIIPPIPPKQDTEFVRHVMIKSELLSKFWGRPMYIGAHILVPAGFDKHPEAHYPLIVFHGHFPDDISEFSTTPPDPNLKPDYSDRFHLAGYNKIQQQEAYDLYKKWISPGFPRYLVIEIEHANPYYDDSYAVNSANLGPYGDAINYELIPYIEKNFRGLGQGWARFTYGGSTGGWEALATQVFYPKMYNGAFAACPDPIDFRAYTVINLYNDKNAYWLNGEAIGEQVERPAQRNYLGEVFATQRGSNAFELALGDHGRSGQQYDIWQAVYGPEGKDGYPQPIFDKTTGEIDPAVAAYWREHYDLSHIIERDWAKLGPDLTGKIHIYVGSADTYYLNNAVYFAQERLEGLKTPPFGGEIDYGDRAEHCWNGDHTLSNAYSRLHYDTFYLPKILDRIKKTAPPGADLTSWRY